MTNSQTSSQISQQTLEEIQNEPALSTGCLEKMCLGLEVSQNVFLQVLLFQDAPAGRKRMTVSDARHHMAHAVSHKDFSNLIENYCVMQVSSHTVKEINGKTILFIDSVAKIQPYSKRIGNSIRLPINENVSQVTSTTTNRDHGNNIWSGTQYGKIEKSFIAALYQSSELLLY